MNASTLDRPAPMKAGAVAVYSTDIGTLQAQTRGVRDQLLLAAEMVDQWPLIESDAVSALLHAELAVANLVRLRRLLAGRELGDRVAFTPIAGEGR